MYLNPNLDWGQNKRAILRSCITRMQFCIVEYRDKKHKTPVGTYLTGAVKYYSLGLFVNETAVLSKSAVIFVKRGFLFSTMIAA